MVAPMMASCASSNGYVKPQKVVLPDLPPHIKPCVSRITKIPKSAKSIKDTRRLIVKLRRSELSKSRCGKQAIKFYENHKRRIEAKK